MTGRRGERSRIEEVYHRYGASDRYKRRWAAGPGQTRHLDRQWQATAAALLRSGFRPDGALECRELYTALPDTLAVRVGPEGSLGVARQARVTRMAAEVRARRDRAWLRGRSVVGRTTQRPRRFTM
jgi:hypothetical protein